MRIFSNAIRYQDKYVVLRNKKDIHIRWWCSGNTWSNDEPPTVRGYANYDGDSQLDDEIALLGMVVNAIIYKHEADGVCKIQRPDPYGTKQDIKNALREWIEANMDVLPDREAFRAQWGLSE